MQIKEKSEDASLAALNRRRDLTSETKPMEELSEIERSRPTEARRESQRGRVEFRERRKGGDRRRGERREEQREVWLETRTPHDRRTRIRRASDRASLEQSEAEQPPKGIDIEC